MKKKDLLISAVIIAAAALTLWLYLQRTGYVEIDAGGAEATLRVRRSWFSDEALMKSEDGPVIMPARRLRPQRLSISTRQGGETWLLYSNGPWGKLSTIEVKNNETTTLRLGPPFTIKPSIRGSGQDRIIDFSIIGRAGEHYSAAIAKNNDRVAPPKLKIVDEQGNALVSGTFAFG